MIGALRLAGAVMALLVATLVLALLFGLCRLFLINSGVRLVPRLFHLMAAWLLGIRVVLSGERINPNGALLVSNHASWLDIIALSTLAPVSFVAKAEVGCWPVIGWLARIQDSVFIDRRRKKDVARLLPVLRERFAQGLAVVLFAEGTSSDGTRVLRFHSSLFEPARQGGVLLQPIHIRYARWHGVPVGRRERPLLAWYGDMTLLPAVLLLLREGCAEIHIKVGAPMAAPIGMGRKELAALMRQQIRALHHSAAICEAEGRLRPSSSQTSLSAQASS